MAAIAVGATPDAGFVAREVNVVTGSGSIPYPDP